MAFLPISYKFLAAAVLTASKTLVYNMTPSRPSDGGLHDKARQSDQAAASGIGVNPNDYMGRFFNTDITLETSSGDALTIAEAVCSVSRSITTVKTVLPGLDGTIKEYVAAGDFELSIVVGLVAVDAMTGAIIDEYPVEGVAKLNEILGSKEALKVNSTFLALFDINRIVVDSYSIEQMTYSNRQVVTIKASSDEDFEIEYNEY